MVVSEYKNISLSFIVLKCKYTIFDANVSLCLEHIIKQIFCAYNENKLFDDIHPFKSGKGLRLFFSDFIIIVLIFFDVFLLHVTKLVHESERRILPHRHMNRFLLDFASQRPF